MPRMKRSVEYCSLPIEEWRKFCREHPATSGCTLTGSHAKKEWAAIKRSFMSFFPDTEHLDAARIESERKPEGGK